LMMERIIAYGRSINLQRITGLVRMENASMLAICHRLGFTRRIDPDMPGLFHVTKELTADD